MRHYTYDAFVKTEAEEIAKKLNASGEWDVDLIGRLCELADMVEEWETADGDNFERVAYEAAEKLGVSF